MNERIKELAEQAGCKVMDDGEWYIPSATGLEKIVYTKGIGLEKFAELIVKECIQVSEAHAKDLESQPTDPLLEAYEDGVVNGIYEATEAIKEHFGVEE
jgi:Na+-transporting NADH:ubiquinone oxidoreductase subunit NqrD